MTSRDLDAPGAKGLSRRGARVAGSGRAAGAVRAGRGGAGRPRGSAGGRVAPRGRPGAARVLASHHPLFVGMRHRRSRQAAVARTSGVAGLGTRTRDHPPARVGGVARL